MGLQKVERDFRSMKTGLLEVRPVFVRKESRTRGHVFACMLALKISREMESRLRAAFGTTDSNKYAITLPDALAAVAPHLKFTLLANCCLIQNDTTKETVGRWNQHHPVFFSVRLAVTFVRNQIRSPKNSVRVNRHLYSFSRFGTYQ
jgi:hypothetical protein